MEQKTINSAVQNCVRVSLDQPNPIAALLGCIDTLKSEGWPTAEIQIVRQTCMRMLAEIYGLRFGEGEIRKLSSQQN
jgi:hypothetical protein